MFHVKQLRREKNNYKTESITEEYNVSRRTLKKRKCP